MDGKALTCVIGKKKELKNIVLTGFMGAGKSTVGRKLASRLGLKFVDLDEEIEKAANKSVKEIFSDDGEERFREYEREAIKRIADGVISRESGGLVVSTGGGVVKDPANRLNLRRIGTVVWLKVSLDEVFKRAFRNGRSDERPLLANNGREAVQRLMLEREPFYAEADFVVDTSEMDVKSAVAEIERRLADACS